MLKLVGGYKSPFFPSCSPGFVSAYLKLGLLPDEYSSKDSISYVYQGESGKICEGQNTL